MRYGRVATVVATILATLVPAVAAQAHDHRYDDGNHVVSDYGTLLLTDELARATMSDVFEEAMFGPCESESGTCDGAQTRTCTTLPADQRFSGGAPPDASQWQVIYFVPSDVAYQAWANPVACNDGQRRESNIGYAVHNTRAWFASRHAQNNALWGSAMKALTKNWGAYGKQWTFYDVMYVRAPNNKAYYQANPFINVKNDLRDMGFDGTTKPHVKYVVFADVVSNTANNGSCVLGQSDLSRYGMDFRTCRNGTTGAMSAQRWGCGDIGDTAVMHEAVHSWGTVAPGSADYDTITPQTMPGTTNHVTQVGDLMRYAISTTLRGTNDTGGPTAVTAWDEGAQSYTSRILAFPAYLTPFSTANAQHGCPARTP